jgi:CRISPR-associated helicase Cas3/CRISPR-associated endonuclease Cas3-HD
MEQPYIAHTREQDTETQSLLDHLQTTAKLAKEHAMPWGGDFAELCGLTHDVGKYSEAFQARIRGGTRRVDHATASGQLLVQAAGGSAFGLLAAYCAMGHHGGLPNGGSAGQDDGDEGTLYGRLRRRVEEYSAYKTELTMPNLPSFGFTPSDGFEAAFFTRMAFSALVDADWLDTERFCRLQNAPRGGFALLPELRERLKVKTDEFLSDAGTADLLKRQRNLLLQNCIDAAKLSKGAFSLTAPTGSGKTVSSLAFALEHALCHGLRRVIYVVPYNTIIEQNASVYEEILGAENVLRHNSDAQYDGEDDASLNKRYSAENWDYPIIVTSSVQFFESLFANKPSRCRKLHNIANSVLVFDEAQMIPVPYLIPCVRAVKTLVAQYGCSAVLASATQSALDGYFEDKPSPLQLTEINRDPETMYNALRRNVILHEDKPLSDDALTERLGVWKRVLCIVNTRRHAQTLFERLRKAEPEGTFHLSTTMIPLHRKAAVTAIRERLKERLPCRVVSTSLVEAGVDLDFDAVYRETAGLDSIVQAGGRCNREGNRPPEDSQVIVFQSEEGNPPSAIRQNIEVYRQIARWFPDVAGLDAIRSYFEQLFYNKGTERLDEKKIVERFNDGAKTKMSFPFADISRDFRLIDDAAQQTVYVLHLAPELEERLRKGERNRELFRALEPYAVSLYENDVRALQKLGAVEYLDESVLLLYHKYYDEQTGVSLSPEGGHGILS